MKILGAAFAMGLVALTALPASATTVTFDWLGNLEGADVSAQINGDEVEPRGEFEAGSLSFQEVGAPNDFVAWCLEVTQLIASQADYTAGATLLDPLREGLISRLFTGYADAAATAVGAAALQLAAWEIIEEESANVPSGLDVTSGRFTAASSTANVAETANLFLSTLDQFEANYRINYFQSADSQDIFTVAPIPIPASILFLGAGIGALAVTRRRQQRGGASA